MATRPATTFDAVNCPLVTPFDSEGGVDANALAALVDGLVERGVQGLVPCGTTGEFASLTDEEHRVAIETTVDAADGRVPVMAGAASTRVEGTLSRLALASDAGADAGLVTLPYYHAANDPRGNEEFLRAVAADSSLPIYLYNIPPCVGVEIAPETVGALADEETVVGMKDTSGDFEYFERVNARTDGDFSLVQGYDSLFVHGLFAGSAGGINALSNAIPESFVAATKAFETGETERAREIQTTEITPLFEICLRYGFAPAAKVAAAARGLVETVSVRPPLVALDAGAITEIEETVRAIVTNYE